VHLIYASRNTSNLIALGTVRHSGSIAKKWNKQKKEKIFKRPSDVTNSNVWKIL
jgi:hypothetical protein